MKYKKAYIEITNACNLSCDFCPKTNRQIEYITEEKFEHVLTEVKQFTNFIYFHLMGEPLMHKGIEKLLDIADKHNMKVNITTNGFLIDTHSKELLRKNALRKMSFSLHSYEGNDSRFKDGNVKPIDKYLNDIFTASINLAKLDKIAVLKLWNIESENITASNKRNDDILKKVEDYFKLDYDLKEKILKDKSVKLSNHIYIQIAEKFKWPDKNNNEENEKIFCYGLIDQFGVLVDGTIVPCCLDNDATLSLGNIYEEKLIDILDSDRATNICNCNKMGKPSEELCKKCNYAKR